MNFYVICAVSLILSSRISELYLYKKNAERLFPEGNIICGRLSKTWDSELHILKMSKNWNDTLVGLHNSEQNILNIDRPELCNEDITCLILPKRGDNFCNKRRCFMIGL